MKYSGSGKHLGARSADDWTSATRSAVAGGTTTVIAFAVQSRGTSMNAAVDEYHELAKGAAMCDYGFHVIVTDPNEEQMKVELPKLVERGITSVKVCRFSWQYMPRNRTRKFNSNSRYI